MNVMLTRAQYLLIVIGDSRTLCKDHNWSQFINYCRENNGLHQSSHHFSSNKKSWEQRRINQNGFVNNKNFRARKVDVYQFDD